MSVNKGAAFSNEILKENWACRCNKLDSFIILDATEDLMVFYTCSHIKYNENPNWDNILSVPCICKNS
jgi:hypothetical protein